MAMLVRILTPPDPAGGRTGDRGRLRLFHRIVCIFAVIAALVVARCGAQEDQLNKIHVQPPTSAAPAPASKPKGAQAPAATGPEELKVRPGPFFRMNGDLGLIPVTVTH